MSTRELIEAELQVMDENQLDELYRVVRQIAEQRPPAASPSLIAKLKKIKIQAPEDFATNLEFYSSGEKRVS